MNTWEDCVDCGAQSILSFTYCEFRNVYVDNVKLLNTHDGFTFFVFNLSDYL